DLEPLHELAEFRRRNVRRQHLQIHRLRPGNLISALFRVRGHRDTEQETTQPCEKAPAINSHTPAMLDILKRSHCRPETVRSLMTLLHMRNAIRDVTGLSLAIGFGAGWYRRQWRRIAIPTITVGTDYAGSRADVRGVQVELVAGVFLLPRSLRRARPRAHE